MATFADAVRDIATLHAQISNRLGELAERIEAPAAAGDPEVASSTDASAWSSGHFPSDSLRGCAERALIEEGGPLDLDTWALRIRRMGFSHPWNPRNPRQLQASLTALPHQTDVFVRVGRGLYDLAERHRT